MGKGTAMIFLIIFFSAIGAWELHIFLSRNYPEDLLLTVGCIGAAAFLLAMYLNGVSLLP